MKRKRQISKREKRVVSKNKANEIIIDYLNKIANLTNPYFLDYIQGGKVSHVLYDTIFLKGKEENRAHYLNDYVYSMYLKISFENMGYSNVTIYYEAETENYLVFYEILDKPLILQRKKR